MTHFLITLDKGLKPENLQQAALSCLNRYIAFRRTALSQLLYVITDTGSVWNDRAYHPPAHDPHWHRRSAYNYAEAIHRATQDTLHYCVPAEQRALLRGVPSGIDQVRLIQNLFLDEANTLFSAPLNIPEDQTAAAAAVEYFAQRLQALSSLLQSLANHYPFSIPLTAPDGYPAYDLSSTPTAYQQHAVAFTRP